MSYKYISLPKVGSSIDFKNGKWIVPDFPIIPFIRGDGTGPDIWAASEKVLNEGIQKAYSGNRKIIWLEVPAGEASFKSNGEWLPEETLEVLKTYRVSIKGPLTTPVGKGIRSLNVALRQILDLYQCIRPVKWYVNVPSPVKHPEKVNMVIFRENTEDIYKGIEYKAYTDEQKKIIEFFDKELNVKIRNDSGLGLKPISEFGSKRLARAAIQYAIDNNKKSVTFVHKGNIMKFTEGAFKEWAYEVGRTEFPEKTISWEDCDGKPPEGKILLKDIIADNMFQQALIKPEDFDVIATTNLNGDYLSDALAAQVGGLGIAPGANIGDGYAVFEATHGTAPKYAGLDKINPGSVILSGLMMLELLGWNDAIKVIENAFIKTLEKKIVTYDFARSIPNARETSCSGFAQAIIDNM